LNVDGEAPEEEGTSEPGNSDRRNDERKHGESCGATLEPLLYFGTV
jgi:hypothetical protein